MADVKYQTDSPTEKDKSTAIKFMGINLIIVAILLVVTELILGSSVLGQLLLLLVTVVVALLPLLTLFVDFGSNEGMFNIGTVVGTVVMCVILYLNGSSTGKFYVEYSSQLTVDDAKAVNSAGSSGIAFVFDADMSDFQHINGLDDINKTNLRKNTLDSSKTSEAVEALTEGGSFKLENIDKAVKKLNEKEIKKGIVFVNSPLINVKEEDKSSFKVIGKYKPTTRSKPKEVK